MFGVNPVRFRMLLKIPVPVPSEVILSDKVVFGDAPQQIPRAVTVAPPSLVTFPPNVAEVNDTEDADVEVSVARPTVVLKLISLPYAVPALLTA